MIALRAWSWPGWVRQPGAEVVAESESEVLLVASAWRRRCVFGVRGLPVRRWGARRRRGRGEERVFTGGLVALVVGEVLTDEVDHEQGVDDPDAVGEVLCTRVSTGAMEEPSCGRSCLTSPAKPTSVTSPALGATNAIERMRAL
jgi:hypothetical protein